MPRKQNYKKKRGRKNNKRKSNKPSFLRIPQSPLPQTMLAKLPYSTRYQIDPNSTGSGNNAKDGSLAAHFFRINSCYDPDYTSSTIYENIGDKNHQPYCYDQWSQLYNSYRVVGVKMTTTFYNQNSYHSSAAMVAADDSADSSNYTVVNQKANAAVFVGHHIDNTTTLPNSFSHMIEMNECKKRTLMPERQTTIVNTWSLKKFMNSQGETSELSDYEGSTSASPSKPAFCGVWVNALTPQAGVNIPAIDCHTKIEFIVLFKDRKETAQS